MTSPEAVAGVFLGWVSGVEVALGGTGLGGFVGLAVGMEGAWVAAGIGVSTKVASACAEGETTWLCWVDRGVQAPSSMAIIRIKNRVSFTGFSPGLFADILIPKYAIARTEIKVFEL